MLGLGFERGEIETMLRPEPACVQGCGLHRQEVLMGESLYPRNGEEVKASAEEQAEDIAKLPTPHQPTLS